MPAIKSACDYERKTILTKFKNSCLLPCISVVFLHPCFAIPEGKYIIIYQNLTMVKKILIAEDDADIRFILNLVLKEAGYEVEPLSAGNSIVEGRRQWPDLFILDKALPTIDGLALCKYLKVKEETKDIPIIMISSYHKLRKKAAEIGVNDFLEKPFDIKALLDVVAKNIKQEPAQNEH